MAPTARLRTAGLLLLRSGVLAFRIEFCSPLVALTVTSNRVTMSVNSSRASISSSDEEELCGEREHKVAS